MGRSLQVAELDLAGGHSGVHVERPGDLQEPLVLVPVDVGVDPQARLAGMQREHLLDCRGSEAPANADRRPQGVGVVHDERLGVGQIDVAVAVEGVDVPRLPVVGGVVMELQQVALAAGGEGLAAVRQVLKRRDEAGAGSTAAPSAGMAPQACGVALKWMVSAPGPASVWSARSTIASPSSMIAAYIASASS
jgi:hypothetical protein